MLALKADAIARKRQSEMMRDVAKRRGVLRVLEDLRRAARLTERDIERVFASGGLLTYALVSVAATPSRNAV